MRLVPDLPEARLPNVSSEGRYEQQKQDTDIERVQTVPHAHFVLIVPELLLCPKPEQDEELLPSLDLIKHFDPEDVEQVLCTDVCHLDPEDDFGSEAR